MPFDPALPQENTPVDAAQMRSQLNGLKALIDAIASRINRRKYISSDYQHVDGTSFASPIAASVAARATFDPGLVGLIG